MKRRHEKMKDAGRTSSDHKTRRKKVGLARSGSPCSKGTRKSTQEKANILIVDDDKLIRKTLKLVLEKRGYETEMAVTGREALERAKERFFNLALLDIRLPDMEGIELLAPLKEMHPDMVVIMVTGYASLETAVRALNEGASAYITKPLKTDELLAIARECLEKQRLAGEKRQAEEALRESEEKFRTLVTGAPIGLSIIAKDGTYEYVNPKFTEIFGYTLEDVSTGKEWFEKAYPDQAHRQKAIACWMEDLKGAKAGETRPRVFTVTCKNDSEKEVFFRPVSLTCGRQLVTYEDVSERNRTEEDLQREKQAVQRLAEQKETVAKIGRIISSTLEIDKVYEFFAKEVGKVITFDRVAITIIDRTRSTFWNAYVLGDDIPNRGVEDVVPLTGSLAEEVMRKRSGVLIQTKDRDEMAGRFPGLLPFIQAGFQSFMAVPLISKDQVIAVLHIFSATSETYTHADVSLAESIGSQIAGAIANAQLYEETKRAKERLRESEERYRMLLNNANDAVFVYQPTAEDKPGKFIEVNDVACQRLGYTREELLSLSPFDIADPEKSGDFPGNIKKILAEKHLVWEWVNATKDGRKIPVEVSSHLFNFHGQPTMLSITRDITERKRAEEALQREKQAVQRLAEERESVAKIGRIISSTLEINKVYELFAEEVCKVIPFNRIGINTIDPERGTYAIAYVIGKDPVGRRAGNIAPLAGSLTAEVMRARSSMLIQMRDIDEVGGRIPRLLPIFQAGLRSLMAVPLISKDRVIGVLHLQSVKPKAYKAADVNLAERIGAQIAGAIANAQLYAEHKRAEETLARQARELARSNGELEQFAYVASHDLQEPLRKVQAFGERLKATCTDALDDRGRDYLQRMQNAAKRLQTLINDLLTFSRVTTRAQPFAPVNLTEVTRDVVSDLELRIERTGGRVEVGDLPTIEADPTQKRQLLQNLIDNGLKFHRPEEPPVVKVNGTLLGDRCQITVRDNGIGFDEKYLDRIFTIFQRLHGRSEYEGTGVGLAVCRKIVERHGGSITAQSTPGQGSTFIITVPVRQSKDQREEMCNG